MKDLDHTFALFYRQFVSGQSQDERVRTSTPGGGAAQKRNQGWSIVF